MRDASLFRMYFVYILESLVDGDFYKGSCSDYLKRLAEHNNGESKFTSSKMPWKLIFVMAFETKRRALIEEKRIKRCNKKYLKWFINSEANIFNKKDR
jgi:putative endonuclease